MEEYLTRAIAREKLEAVRSNLGFFLLMLSLLVLAIAYFVYAPLPAEASCFNQAAGSFHPDNCDEDDEEALDRFHDRMEQIQQDRDEEDDRRENDKKKCKKKYNSGYRWVNGKCKKTSYPALPGDGGGGCANCRSVGRGGGR